MKIILFRGRPGSGKSTITHAFAERSHLPVIRKDDIYDPVSRYIPEHSNRNKASFDVLYKILESNKHSEATFILDFSFQNKEDLSVIKNWCSKRGVKFKSIIVTCSDEKLWAERFNRRAENPAPNQLITNFEELRKHYGTMQVDPEEGELIVDTVQSVDDILKEIIEYTK